MKDSQNIVSKYVILIMQTCLLGCPLGHYGSNCTKSCPKKCQGPCEPENGNCTFGCISGWTGEKCGQGMEHMFS